MFMQSVICDLDSSYRSVQAEAGQCFGSVQFRSSLSGASQTLMSMQSGGWVSRRGPISLVGSAAGPPQAPVCHGLMDYSLSWLRSVKSRRLPQAPSVSSLAPACLVVTVLHTPVLRLSKETMSMCSR